HICHDTYMFNVLHTHRYLHAFPTRRSSDLHRSSVPDRGAFHASTAPIAYPRPVSSSPDPDPGGETAAPVSDRVLTVPNVISLVRDRKSTRLNSSHVSISYAVFCLKKELPY